MQILGRDAGKNDRTEYTTINDLMLGKGQVTLENYPLIVVKGVFLQTRYTNKKMIYKEKMASVSIGDLTKVK